MSETRTTADLQAAIERAGYYPALVGDTMRSALAGEGVLASVVHLDTTFDGDEVRRHVTVLALTPTRLVVGHTDDHAEPGARTSVATTSTESLALERVASVVVTRVVADPADYRSGALPQEITLTVGWGAVSRLDLEPASCGDSGCEADHGYTGTSTADDLSLRVSSVAEGVDAVSDVLRFAEALSAATRRS
jgi:hypothetical protein